MGEEGREFRVLVVDDDDLNRLLLVDVLTGGGCRVLSASNGTDAVKILEEQPVDLLITDYDMPRMNGLDLIRWSKARFPHVTAVMVTGQDSQVLSTQGRKCGALRVLLKPLSVGDFLSLVDKIRDTVPFP